MSTHNFYEDRRFCPACQDYVRYLSSPSRTYCVQCGGPATLFSSADLAQFRRTVKRGGSTPRIDNEQRAPVEA